MEPPDGSPVYLEALETEALCSADGKQARKGSRSSQCSKFVSRRSGSYDRDGGGGDQIGLWTFDVDVDVDGDACGLKPNVKLSTLSPGRKGPR